MTEQEWTAVMTIVQETDATTQRALADHLASAVHAFGVPVPVVERVHHATTVAVDRAVQNDATRPICLCISMRVIEPQAARAPASWGFFIVERAAADEQPQHIEVFLYREAGY